MLPFVYVIVVHVAMLWSICGCVDTLVVEGSVIGAGVIMGAFIGQYQQEILTIKS